MSGLRDPNLYADLDRFDIGRTDLLRWHMVFVGGAHRRLRKALAIAECEERGWRP